VAGDKRHNPTGAHNIKTFREEVIVDRAREVRTSPVRRIEDRVIPE
jgi:hypothetical protein